MLVFICKTMGANLATPFTDLETAVVVLVYAANPYPTKPVLGSGIARSQNLVQIFLPRLPAITAYSLTL
jgi:hypothetical protein